MDKPGKHPDPYHTMYSLAGTSVSQYKSDYENLYAPTDHVRAFTALFNGNYGDSLPEDWQGDREDADIEKTCLLGNVLNNRIRRINSIYGARFDYIEKTKKYYRTKYSQSDRNKASQDASKPKIDSS